MTRPTLRRTPRTVSLTPLADEYLTKLSKAASASKSQTIIDALYVLNTLIESSESGDVFTLRILSRYTKQTERINPHGSNA